MAKSVAKGYAKLAAPLALTSILATRFTSKDDFISPHEASRILLKHGISPEVLVPVSTPEESGMDIAVDEKGVPHVVRMAIYYVRGKGYHRPILLHELGHFLKDKRSRLYVLAHYASRAPELYGAVEGLGVRRGKTALRALAVLPPLFVEGAASYEGAKILRGTGGRLSRRAKVAYASSALEHALVGAVRYKAARDITRAVRKRITSYRYRRDGKIIRVPAHWRTYFIKYKVPIVFAAGMAAGAGLQSLRNRNQVVDVEIAGVDGNKIRVKIPKAMLEKKGGVLR